MGVCAHGTEAEGYAAGRFVTWIEPHFEAVAALNVIL
jgi:hypothetical protein